jgi:methyl-accepting chemotaxis protein
MYDTSLNLQNRVQRSITPGIVAIIASILFSLMWIYFLNRFLLRPIIQINKGIKSRLQYGTAYKVKIDTGDELEELNDSVDRLLEK